MTNILFLCVHNSARSQMAEAYFKKYASENFLVESAGLEAGSLNPYAVEVMMEEGIDISNNKTKNVFDLYKEGKMYHYVVTVCDEASAAKCPIFPSVYEKLNWSFEDPSQFTGTKDQKLEATRIVRDKIREAVIGLVNRLAE